MRTTTNSAIKTKWRRFFITVWALLPNIGGVAGLVALTSPVVAVLFSPQLHKDPSLALMVNYTVWILVISFVTILALTVVSWSRLTAIEEAVGLRLEIALNKDQQRDIAEIVHNLTHETRNQIFNLMMAAEKTKTLSDRERVDALALLSRNWGMYNLYYLDNFKRLLDLLTNQNNSVCIKIFRTEYFKRHPDPKCNDIENAATDEIVYSVKTYFRDTRSYSRRHENDIRLEKYNAMSNSAFAHILSDDTKDFFYFNNDLESDRTYINTNARWREFYNSVMVSPIRIENFSRDRSDPHAERYRIFGFLCADSLKSQYRREVELHFLHAFADLYVPVLSAFDSWQRGAMLSQCQLDQSGGLDVTKDKEPGSTEGAS